MSSRFKKKMTAAEAMALLHSDPEWVRQQEERDRKSRAFGEMLRENELPILADLAKMGWKLDSVWILANIPDRYPELIPVLLEHMHKTYHPRIMEGIARALTVREARGAPAREMLDMLKSQSQTKAEGFRWALANAMTVVADKSMVEELEALLENPDFKNEHGILKLAMKRLTPRKKPQQ